MGRVNRLKDFIERVGWTGIQIVAGAIISWAATGDAWSWYTFFGAVAVAVAKVVLAQRVGTRGSGDAIPGGVEK